MAREIRLRPQAFEDVAWWVQHDRKTAQRLLRLLEEIARTPFTGVGKPEPLKGEFSGCWSRRLTEEHRVVYEATDDAIVVRVCRGHYS